MRISTLATHLPFKIWYHKTVLNGSWCQHRNRRGFGRFPPRFSGYTSENPFDLLSATFIIPRPTEKRKVREKVARPNVCSAPAPHPQHTADRCATTARTAGELQTPPRLRVRLAAHHDVVCIHLQAPAVPLVAAAGPGRYYFNKIIVGACCATCSLCRLCGLCQPSAANAARACSAACAQLLGARPLCLTAASDPRPCPSAGCSGYRFEFRWRWQLEPRSALS